jgi:hypothetical protein
VQALDVAARLLEQLRRRRLQRAHTRISRSVTHHQFIIIRRRRP